MAQNQFNWPINPTSVSLGAIEFIKNGVPTPVEIDTGTPANSNPFPVRLIDGGGDILAFNNDYGAASGALRTASQVGNATGQADFGAGASGAQTLRVEANQGAAGSTPWPVTGPLTDTQLRATPVPVSGTVTANQGTANATPWNVAVSNFPATQPVSGTVSVDNFPATQAISAVSLPLPTGAATETTLSAINTKTPALVGGSVPAVLTTGAAVIGSLVANQSVNTAQINGVTPLMGNGVTGTGSQRVTIASDNTPFGVIASSVINTGSFAQLTNLVATAQTMNAPANAIGFKIQAPSTNTENIAFSIGATATITAGILMEPGRSEDFDTGSNISVIATSAAAQTVTVIWKVKP